MLVIVINDGTDHDKDIMPEAELTEAYATFVAHVRAVHPKAWILISESGFHPNAGSGRQTTMREELLKTLNAVATRRHAAGDSRIRVIRTAATFPARRPTPIS